MILITRTFVVGLAVAAGLAACGGDDDGSGAAGDQIAVVASFYPLAEAVRQVGGELVEVEDLTPAGAEPHDLELTTDQVDDLEDADLVVVMGRDFQPAVEDVAERRDGTTIVVLDEFDVGEGRVQDEHAEEEGGDEHGDEEGALDPHVWLDPTRMRTVVNTVEAALAGADPTSADTYSANAEVYGAQLDTLDADFEAGLENCDRREMITAHEAFGWMAARYDLEQHAIAGLEPDQEPSADRIAELADLAANEGATTVFTETLVSPDVAETVAREAGGLRTRVLDPIEGLTEEQRDNGDDYVSLMRANLAELREALGCS
jgi:zinc transport system substrate-binding protein